MNKYDKIKATKAEMRARFDAQTVTIDENWSILRADELNWEIRYKGKFQGFYGSIGGAIRALPAKMLSEDAKGTLKDVLRSLGAITATIEKAVPA